MTTALRRDLRRAAALALVGCAAIALVDYVSTIWVYPGDVALGMGLRLAALTATLSLVLWVVTFPLLGGAAVLARVSAWLRDRDAGRRWAGLYVLRDVPTDAALPARPAGAVLWGLAAGALVYVNLSTLATIYFVEHFKEPQLTALVLGVLQLAMFGVAAGLAWACAALVARGARALHPRLGGWNPLGRAVPALAAMVLLAVPAVRVLLSVMPQLEPLVPWRHVLAALAFGLGAYLGALLLRRRGHLVPAAARRLPVLGAAGVAVAALVFLSLTRFGADPQTRYAAISSSPPMASVIDLVRVANDFDGDGYGSLLGEADCAPFDATIHPGARDVPDDGIDQNCNGSDFSLSSRASYETGERMAVPDEYQRDWNILLLTIDTVRYDHTSFGGYPEKRGRDTTPNLADLVDRSVSFTFANAPSAGTMASIPAILTSKFFHSGIALDEDVEPGMPPRLTPKNTLISEILKRGGYKTGAILTHEYFNDWGMEQGFDEYDNELGAEPDPFKITSPDVTDRAIAWISRNADRKWFLWAHYLDPHGRYVAHPGDVSYGDSEEDLYDGELHFTDKHVGRLLDELKRMPGADRTIIIITSDHGDGFNEHGFINHGMALYKELLHVPLIFYIPELEPREVPGATSPLDIVPTVADLTGIDVSDLSFEGQSLVPQLFYKRDAHDRVVFAETNWPKPLRAAITSRYKLVYNLKNNIYELYDLREDPWEKRNIAHEDEDADALAKMKRYLDDWLERVYYARDPETNQAAAKLDDVLLDERPEPEHPVQGVSFDDGRIEVLGYDVGEDTYGPGDKIPIAVYFHAMERPTAPFRLQVEGWLADDDDATPGAARSKLRFTAGGVFPTQRWRPGEFIRDRFGIRIPETWSDGRELVIGLRMATRDRKDLEPTGETRPGHDDVVVLGRVKLAPSRGAEAPRRKQLKQPN